MKNVRIINKAVNEAAASMWIDNLPLSKEYVENFRQKKLSELNNIKVLRLKRGGINGKGRKQQ